MKFVYSISLGIGLTIAFFLYFIFFDEFSETELISFSFVWIFLIAFGAMGLIFKWGYKLNKGADPEDPGQPVGASGKGALIALVIGLVALFGLLFFFMTIWGSL